jgi:hypothetical protein
VKEAIALEAAEVITHQKKLQTTAGISRSNSFFEVGAGFTINPNFPTKVELNPPSFYLRGQVKNRM